MYGCRIQAGGLGMHDMEDDAAATPPAKGDFRKRPHLEDEINLVDYFALLWKWMYLILVCSVVPAVVWCVLCGSGPKE